MKYKQSLTFIIETINSINGGTFMIATQNEEIFRILDFVCKKQADRLQRLLSTIHIVTKNLNNKSQDEIGW